MSLAHAIREVVGGYSDWLRQRPAAAKEQESAAAVLRPQAPAATVATDARRKLSYKEQREFDALPATIERLEDEERQLNARIASAEFYKEGADAIKTALARVETLKAELEAAYARWTELEDRA